MTRLSPGTLILGVFAILFGLVGAYGVKRYMQQPVLVEAAPQPPPKIEKLQVPVAVADLPTGRTLAQGDFSVIAVTREEAVKSKFPSMWMGSGSQLLGRTLRQTVKGGMPFEPSAFYLTGMGPNVVDDLQPGERAVTIPLKKDSADLTFLTPGATVDVLFRANPDSTGDTPDATVTLLSGVRVLAIGQTVIAGASLDPKDKDSASGDMRPVTLAVNQTQARALKVVEGRGSMMLALRNAKDITVADRGGPTSLPGLLGMKESQLPYVTEIYRRGRLATMTFRDGQRQKIKLDPPFGLPVTDATKGPKANELEVWPSPAWGWGGRGYGSWGNGTWNNGFGGYGGGYGY